MSNELEILASGILSDLLKETDKAWIEDSKYREFRSLSIDKRGSFGERFFTKVLPARRIEYFDGDQGDWDLKLDNIKFEVKTSSLDSNKKFQNERIKKDGDYFGLLFLGIKPNDLCIKFIKQSDIEFDKLHNRGDAGTGAGYKWDFKENDMLIIKNIEQIKEEFVRVFKSNTNN